MNSNATIGRSNSRKHYHEQSMDDFMKNIKKFNLRSERYISPKPLLYMYAKNNTTNTIQKSRSRTLSNNKSHSKRDKKQKNKSHSKAIRTKLQKIFKQKSSKTQKTDTSHSDRTNPAQFIQACGEKLKKAEKYLDGKSQAAKYLCEEFLSILNQIVEKMVNQLDSQLKQIQYKTQKKVQAKYKARMQKLEKKLAKMDNIISDLNAKAENNSKLLYQLRLSNLIDIDYLFGKAILGTDKCGGQGYFKGQSYKQSNRQSSHSRKMQIQRIKQGTQQNNPNKQFDKRLDIMKIQFRKDNIEEKQSGRIRPAYDWEKQAHDDVQRHKKDKKAAVKRLITQMEFQQQEQYEPNTNQFQRKST